MMVISPGYAFVIYMFWMLPLRAHRLCCALISYIFYDLRSYIPDGWYILHMYIYNVISYPSMRITSVGICTLYRRRPINLCCLMFMFTLHGMGAHGLHRIFVSYTFFGMFVDEMHRTFFTLSHSLKIWGPYMLIVVNIIIYWCLPFCVQKNLL